MWENRCKVAVSGVGFSKVTRSAEIPLAAHALTAVKEAVADSGLQMSDIDGLATYPELPATGPRGGRRHLDRVGQLHDGDAEIAQSQLAHPGRHDEHRRRRAAGGQRIARRGVQIRGGVAGDAQPARHLPEPSRRSCAGRRAVHRALRLWRPGAGHGGRLYPLARAAQPEPREDGDIGGDAAPPHAAQPARLFLRHGADARGLPELADGGVSVLPVRLRHPGAGGGRDRVDDGRPGARPEAAAGLPRRLRPAAAFRGGGPHRQPRRATWRAAAARRN